MKSVFNHRRLAIAGLFLFAVSVVILPGCNTVKGAGEDLQEASDNTRDAIRNN